MTSAQARDLRVAIVGAGPAGMYTAEAICAQPGTDDVQVDIFDRVPSPFGLVRYGVAPDHLSIRSVRDTLDRFLDEPRIRFFGGVAVGDDDPQASVCLSLDDLTARYDAVVLTYGASTDRPLGIPGENLPGSVSATRFVRWYTGHPDAPVDDFTDALRTARNVVVLGVGNVAVDVTRVLCKTVGELSHTDMPDHVLAALADSSIEHVYLVGRRGPAEASWTTKELKELGHLAECAVDVAPGALPLGAGSQNLVDTNKVAARNVAVIEEWAGAGNREAPRHLTVRFYARPTSIIGTDHVEGIELERTVIDDDGSVRGTGETEVIDADLVIRSVGYRGEAMPGVPFDDRRGVITHEDGRVMGEHGVLPGLYVAGWIKRGPSGIIGTNKKDAVATVASLFDDLNEGRLPAREVNDDVTSLLHDDYVDIDGWRAIDEAERARGEAAGRDRVTIHERTEAMRIGRAATS